MFFPFNLCGETTAPGAPMVQRAYAAAEAPSIGKKTATTADLQVFMLKRPNTLWFRNRVVVWCGRMSLNDVVQEVPRPKGRVGTPFAPHSSTSVTPLEQFINEQWVIKPS